MIRYKIRCLNNYIVCEKREKNLYSIIKIEDSFKNIINGFIENGYKIIWDGKNLILSGKDSYIYMEDYNTVLSADCMSILLRDINRVIKTDGFTKTSPRKKRDSKKNKRFYDETIIRINTTNNIGFLRSGDRKNHRIVLKSLAEYVLLLSLAFHITPVNLNGINPNSINIEYENDDAITPLIYQALRFNDNSIDTMSIDDTEETEDALDIDLYCEKLYDFLVKEGLTLDQFSELLTLMTMDDLPFGFNYETEADAFLDICFRDERSYQEKMLIIMIRDGLSYSELDTVCAGCVSESVKDGTCYEECYAVASTLINRSHTRWYVDNYGINIHTLFTAPCQYTVYKSGRYKKFLGCIDLEGYQAAIDVFYTKESMHNYLGFRGSNYDVDGEYETFVKNGNKFISEMKESDYVPYEEIIFEDESSMRSELEKVIIDLNISKSNLEKQAQRESNSINKTKNILIRELQ